MANSKNSPTQLSLYLTANLLAALTIQCLTTCCTAQDNVEIANSDRELIRFSSSLDQTEQRAYFSIPKAVLEAKYANKQKEVALVVSLHSWSGDLEQRNLPLETLIAKRGWYCLQPDFRGRNDDPMACGSLAAQQDILDAVDWAIANHPIDKRKVYLTGVSGGGHMTFMMFAKYPERWTAASAWVGISDLNSWYQKHAQGKYGEMMRQCCGGAPSDSPEVAKEYHARSPLGYLRRSSGYATPLDIAAGVHDGYAGSVPVQQSLDAYNAIVARRDPKAIISEAEIQQISGRPGRLASPKEGDEGFDTEFDREHYLRRQSNDTRITIFEGGHEGIASAAVAWFDRHGWQDSTK